jgi:5-methylcytosine-specific restriction endonuclease McrA
MSRFIPEKLRAFIAQRADFRCEYCLVHQEDLMLTCQIDHVISVKHGGLTEPGNLAFCCLICNINKGSDIGTILFPTHEFVRFFNPRNDHWSDHFELKNALILPKTKIGEATAKIFQFNMPQRVMRREFLIAVEKHPPQT